MISTTATLAATTVDTVRLLARDNVLTSLLDLPRLVRHAVWRTDHPRGHGRGLLVVPASFGGAGSLAVTRSWLRRCVFRPGNAGIGLDIGCTGDLAAKPEQRV